MAKILMEELTNYEAWQMEKYGSIVSEVESSPAGELMNSGLEELSRLAEWVFYQSKRDNIFMIDLS